MGATGGDAPGLRTVVGDTGGVDVTESESDHITRSDMLESKVFFPEDPAGRKKYHDVAKWQHLFAV